MKRIACAIVCALAAGGAASAENAITAISFGRADQAALTKAYYRPFTVATGIEVKSLSYDGQTTELRQMANAGNAPWDVIQVESRTLQLGCESGLFEKLDYSRIAVPRSDFIPGALSECGVGIFAWSVALAYDADKLKVAPRSSQREIHAGNRAARRRRTGQERLQGARDERGRRPGIPKAGPDQGPCDLVDQRTRSTALSR